MKRATLLLLILLAFFLRVWQLPQTPPGLWYDEAYYSMDAAWLLDGGPWQIFFAGNNGREPIFIYLQTLFIWMFGARPLTSRLLAPLIGTLTVSVIYVLARRLARDFGGLEVATLENKSPISSCRSVLTRSVSNGSFVISLVATAGLAISFWHIGLSRGGYRGILLPLAAALVFYTFWRGWQAKSLKWMALAGVALGLSQYTYLAARALPLALALFALIWSLLNWRDKPRLKFLWLSLLLMAVVSALIFAPLGWLFYNDPALFSARTGDVLFTPDTSADLFTHLLAAIRLFIDAGDPNWRHHLPGRPMLGWLGWLGFWPGLVICLAHLRRPAYLFLVTVLLALYLPALLSVPPVHALRLSAILPLYYVIFAVGLLGLGGWIAQRGFKRADLQPYPILAALLLVFMIELGFTVSDYFARWAVAEDTYVEYNGPLVDFVEDVIDQTWERPVIIPLQIYVHPTTRYLLHDQFVEQAPAETLSGPVTLVTLPNNFQMLNVANIPPLPSFVWLARNAAGQGVAYVSRPPREVERFYLNEVLAQPPDIYRDRFEREVAQLRTIADLVPLTAMFTERTPLRTINLNWANQAELVGYEVVPDVVQPGQPLTLNLYWRSLTDKTFEYRLFLQLIDSAGNPINQLEEPAFREDMYRWRPDGLLPTQHTLWLGPDTPPGAYFVRFGFFDPKTGERLALSRGAGERRSRGAGEQGSRGAEETAVDQVQLGLFYVTADGSDPRQPAISFSANFSDVIELSGVTIPDIHNSQFTIHNLQFPVTFHWSPLQPTDRPYTVFLQLLDDQGNVVSSWDSQPFNGLYPTTFWSPGEVIVDTFVLPLPEDGLPSGAYSLISGFYDFETGRRLPVVGGGDFVVLATFGVE